MTDNTVRQLKGTSQDMNDADRPYLLKIFSGLHAGAEVPLTDGEYRVGVGDECDFILEDGAAGNLELRIGLDNGRMTVTEAKGLCYLDGEPISAGGLDFDAYQVITIGATHFSLGPADDQWPDFHPPQIKPPEVANAAQNTLGEDETDITEPVKPELTEEPPPADGATTPDAAGALEYADLLQSKAPMAKRLVAALRQKGGIGAVASAAVIIMFTLLFLFADRSLPPEDGLAQARETAENLLETYHVISGSIEVDAESRLAISGFIELASDKKELSRQLEKIAFPKTIKLMAIDESLRIFESVLQNYRLRLKVTHEGNGVLVLSGFVRDSDLLRAILARLHQDLPMITQIKVRVHTHEDIIPAIFEELEKSGGISGRIELQAHADHIRVEGNFFPSDREIWEKVKTDIQSRFGEDMQIKDAFIVKPEVTSGASPAAPTEKENLLGGLAGLKGQIAGVILSPRRYLLTSDGKKCFEGGQLAGGYMVNRIEPDRIVLIKGGNNISIPLLP
jgi:type III secretion protein D